MNIRQASKIVANIYWGGKRYKPNRKYYPLHIKPGGEELGEARSPTAKEAMRVVDNALFRMVGR